MCIKYTKQQPVGCVKSRRSKSGKFAWRAYPGRQRSVHGGPETPKAFEISGLAPAASAIDQAGQRRRRRRRPQRWQIAAAPLRNAGGGWVGDGRRQPRLTVRHRGRRLLCRMESAGYQAVELDIPATGPPHQTEIALPGMKGKHRYARCSRPSRGSHARSNLRSRRVEGYRVSSYKRVQEVVPPTNGVARIEPEPPAVMPFIRTMLAPATIALTACP